MCSCADNAAPVLAIDIGGTKIAAALAREGRLLDRRQAATPRDRDASTWIAAIRDLTSGWPAVRCVGAAVTGLVRDGRWTALNPTVLPITPDFPIVDRLSDAFDVPALAVNDAQAAAWGEWVASGRPPGTLIFATVSTGIGGGVVHAGRLVEGCFGAAGSLGHIPVAVLDGVRCGCGGIGCVEAEASGSALAARAAARLGRPCDVPELFERAASEDWAAVLLDRSSRLVAAALAAAMRIVDPAVLALGGGIGLRPDYRVMVRDRLAEQDPAFAARLVPARLAADAGLLGAAALAEAAFPA